MDRRALFSSAAAATLLAATGVSASHPVRGGRLRLALSGGCRQDSWTRGDGLFMQVARQGLVFDTLTELAADGTLKPELAVAWSSSDDGSSWTLELREGVSFHDGTPLTSQDVVASLGRTLDGDVKSDGPLLVKVTLSQADPTLPLRLSEPEHIIRPAHAMESGIGTGLYAVEIFDPGQRLIARRVTNHYKDGVAGWFDEVELASIPSENVRLQALSEKLIDATDCLSIDGLELLNDIDLQPRRKAPFQAVSANVLQPKSIGFHRPLDNLRAAERWWFS